MGKNITLVGGNGDGQTAKVANQIIVALNIEAVAEALLFASRAGADPARVREALLGGFASSKILRSEEHTSELQSPCNLVCRLLLEKKKATLLAGVALVAHEGGLSELALPLKRTRLSARPTHVRAIPLACEALRDCTRRRTAPRLPP